jgi:hypothetical protein
MQQLSLFTEQEMAHSGSQSNHYDWPTIDRCSAAAQARNQRLYMDALGRHYTLYGPGLGDYGWEQYATLDALCAALGIPTSE